MLAPNFLILGMRKILIFISISVVGIIALTAFIAIKFGFTKDNTIAILGYFSIFSSAILLYFSLDVNLKYNKRKSAMDFLYDRMQKDLLPVYKELKGLTNKDFFLESGGKTFKQYQEQEKDNDKKNKTLELTNEILTFYDRMAIGILKKAYDQDICFDDCASEMLHFHDWSRTYLESFQEQYDKRSFVNFSHLAEQWRIRYEKQRKRLEKENKNAVKKEETVANKRI
jgi:hypothetical protein